MKKFPQLLAVFLSAIIITQSYTAVAFAADQPQAGSQTANTSVEAPGVTTDGTASADPQIIAEVTQKRTENTKTFLMDDGTYLLASYNEPIHYKDSGGVWQDIDNTLSEANVSSDSSTPSSSGTQESDSLTSEQTFENKAGATKFNFAKSLKKGKAVSLSTGAYTLHWELDGANTASAQVIQDQTDTSSESHNDQFLKLKKLHSEVEYKDALPGVDVQYITSSGSVKENLLLNSNDTQKQFTETYQIGDMTVKQVDDKAIQLFGKSDTQQKNPIYTITAPVMTDAEGQVSNGVSVSILKQDAATGTLQIAIHTDESWLNDESRAYPVTVDPNIWTKQDASYIRDTFVASGSGYHNVAGLSNTMGTMYIGYESANYKTCRILLNFTLPQLSKGDMVVGANLVLSQYPNGLSPSSATMRINAYQMLSSWNESTVTWDNSASMMDNAMSKPIVDYANVSQSTNCNTWDISKIVKSWYGGAANDGILLTADDEAALARNVYVASNYPDGQGAYPIMSIQYVNNAGLEDYWTFHNQSAGQTGTSSVNDYTGNLVFAAPIMNTTGEKVPLNFSLYYNGYHSGTHFADGQKGDIYGWGWQSNLSQRIDPADPSLGSDYKYVFLDEDGTQHYFITDPNDSSKIIDEDGLGMELTTNTSSTDEYYIFTYKDGSKKTFTSSGYLKKIYDSDNNALTLFYYGAYLNHVTDGAGRDISIHYATSGAVTSITGPDGKTTTLNYTGSNLSSTTGPDGTGAQFVYDTSNRLSKATNIDGTYLQYTYYSASDPMLGNRVASSAEYSAAGAIGNKVTFTYNADNSTTFKYYKAGQSDDDAQKETYNFDNVGRTVSVLNADGSAATYSYQDSSTKDAAANKLTTQAGTSKPVMNLLLDNNAELNNVTWSGSNWGTPGGVFSVDNSTAYLGTKSLKVTQSQTTPQRSGAVQSLTNLTPGSVYTLSGYVKTSAVTGADPAKGASLYAAFFNGGTGISNVTGKIIQGTNDWQRISLTFTVPANTTRTEIYGGLCYANGTAWFDCMQLELGSVANLYNLLDNGDFRYSSNYIPTNWGTTNFTSGDGMSQGYVNINGDPDLNKNINQTVYINKPASSVAFSVSALAQANSVPTNGSGRYFAIDLGIFYTDGTTQWNVVPFNPDTTGEQYVSKAIAPSSANRSKTVNKVVYYIIYYLNENSAVFKNLQMNLDDTGTTYSYDSEGNLVTSQQNAKNTASYSFTAANELSGTTDQKNESYSYTYDTNHQHQMVAARSSQTGTGFAYGYDASGNVTDTKMGTISTSGVIDTSSSPYLESTQGYSSNGNYVTSGTDQRGKTTTYDVDSSTGLTNSVTDPNGNATSYSYNSLNDLLTGVSAQSNAGTVQNSYGYDTGNRLNQITHNGFDYTFTRDGYGNTTIIDVGSRNLITNIFASGNGNLLQSNYGNGFQLGYFYDALDRVTSITKSGATAYLYTYDARGNLAKATDRTSGSDRVTQYSYDIGDRLIRISNPDGSEIKYSYDSTNRPTGGSYTFAGQTKSTSFDYGFDNRKHNTFLTSGGEVTHAYDTLNREFQTDINPVQGQDPTFRAERTYVPVSGNRTTTLVNTYSNYKRVGGSNTALSQYQYTYDDNGNIKTVTDQNGKVTTYHYDGLNQLVRADDQANSVSTAYTYDVGGNITAANTYAYTDPEEALGTAAETASYAYGDSDWKDLLTNYNGQAITYDGIGNPLTYRSGMSFTWEGRQLKTAVANGKDVSYTYNDNGIRTGKTVDGTTTNYFLDGNTIVAQQTGDDILWFLYDSDGTRVGFTYNGTTYYYTKDAQGDVTGIVDDSCNSVVEYTYDAWGKLLSTTGSLASTVGAVNPFLYRGYYYDSDTGLYSLQSRYYDPETGRFINADWQISDCSDLIGTNLFAYCGNNPVMREDPTGQAWWQVAVACLAVVIVCAAVVAAAPVLVAAGVVTTGMTAAVTTGAVITGTAALAIGSTACIAGMVDAIPKTAAPPKTTIKTKTKTKDITQTQKKNPVLFPENPADFHPAGLTPLQLPGTKNGPIIKWMAGKNEVFEWDANTNGPAGNGAHYHIRELGDIHFYPGMAVPEPYATIYFGGQ